MSLGCRSTAADFAPYWWPNPDTATGLPYIRRDGARNPEIYKIQNRLDLGQKGDVAETLALSYYVTGDEVFAARAAVVIRTWFLDPTTGLKYPEGPYATLVADVPATALPPRSQLRLSRLDPLVHPHVR